MSKNEDNVFPDRFLKKLPEGFYDSMASADTDELKGKILESERHLYEIEQDKDNNEKLKELKEMVKEISAPYRDCKSSEAAKIKYCLFLLEGRGIKV